MTQPTATINGNVVAVQPGDTLLDLAHRADIHVPTLCHVRGLVPEGGCRMCMVDVDGHLQAACHTPARAGAVIRTHTAELRELRRGVLSLILSEHRPGAFKPDPMGNEVERLMAELDLQTPLFGDHGGRTTVDQSHPYLRFDPSLCITCRRCLNACEQVQGQFVYGVAGRGAATQLIYGPSGRFADSDCTACGACVDRCPTGAISDRDRQDTAETERITDSVCGYCGVGCRIRVESGGGRVLRIHGVPDAAVNHGHLCGKGRYAHGYARHGDRLTTPLLRDGDGWRAVSWNQAVEFAASRLREIRDREGPDALAAISSSRSTNEACYLLQKLFRTALETNNVDCCARVCHASTALALQTVTGTGAASASYQDIDTARCICIAGANPTEAHPVVGARLKQAVLRGVPLVVIDPRRIELANYAGIHLQLRPGTNVMLFNAIAKVMLDRNVFDAPYVADRLEGFDELRQFLATLSLEHAAEVTGVPAGQIVLAAELLGESGPVLFVHGLGLSELTQGTASVMTLCNLGMLTGSIGRAGAGMLPLRGQNNVQGNADMGGMPTQVTGYQPLSNPAVRERFESAWQYDLPKSPGKTIPEMLDAAARGELKALWVQGVDLAQSESNQRHAVDALRRLELLIVQDLFLCETARYAHLVLPSAAALEQEGTFTNGERRIQQVRPAIAPPGQAKPDWQAVADVAAALGQTWDYATPADVMDEIAAVAPKLFGGVAYSRLTDDGLQWPCPEANHPGTATVHADAFLRGKGRLVTIEHQASPEEPTEDYPCLLITGRVLQQYNVGTMTRRTPSLALAPVDRLEIHPDDATRAQIGQGQWVEIESRWGRARATAQLSDRMTPGVLFLSFHDPATHTNLLVGPRLDPQSKCPEYKLTAVRVAPAVDAEGNRR